MNISPLKSDLINSDNAFVIHKKKKKNYNNIKKLKPIFIGKTRLVKKVNVFELNVCE